ncbi:hypothetical protein FB451DRAFT_1186367 [Mycena latifolia]|nr:hypothetical protein FB451DRAFT_1186367 [Mycena latifolia]
MTGRSSREWRNYVHPSLVQLLQTCGNCLELLANQLTHPGAPLICPACFLLPGESLVDWAAKNKVLLGKGIAYRGLWNHFAGKAEVVKFRGLKALCSSWPTISTPSLAIVSLPLWGTLAAGDPVSIVYHYLAPYHRQKIHLVDLEHNFIIDEYTAALAAELRLLHKYAIGESQVWTVLVYSAHNLVVFISSHSTLDTGDLHVAPRMTAVAEISQALNILIPGEFQAIVHKMDLCALVLLPPLGPLLPWVLDVHGSVQGWDKTHPNRDSIPLQCPMCHALAPWKTMREDTVTLRMSCTACTKDDVSHHFVTTSAEHPTNTNIHIHNEHRGSENDIGHPIISQATITIDKIF